MNSNTVTIILTHLVLLSITSLMTCSMAQVCCGTESLDHLIIYVYVIVFNVCKSVSYRFVPIYGEKVLGETHTCLPFKVTPDLFASVCYLLKKNYHDVIVSFQALTLVSTNPNASLSSVSLGTNSTLEYVLPSLALTDLRKKKSFFFSLVLVTPVTNSFCKLTPVYLYSVVGTCFPSTSLT